MPRFTYDDIVEVVEGAPDALRPGSRAWVTGVIEDRSELALLRLAEGTLYNIEFEDGEEAVVHESVLRLAE
jgi:hypothetical protein